MAKKKRKLISTEESNIEPQEGGAELADKNEPVGTENTEEHQEGSVPYTDAGSTYDSHEGEVDPVDNVRRTLRNEESRQIRKHSGKWWSRSRQATQSDDTGGAQASETSKSNEPGDDDPYPGGVSQVPAGKYSGRWWSRSRQTSQPDETADFQVPDSSNPEVPTGENNQPGEEEPQEDSPHSGKHSGKWWSRGLQSIRYEEASEDQSAKGSDDEMPTELQPNQPPDVQGDRNDEKGFVSTIARKYAPFKYDPEFLNAISGSNDTQRKSPIRNLEMEELKRKAFQPRILSEEEDMPEIRSIALEGVDEPFIEVQPMPTNTLGTRVVAVENTLRPYKRFIFAGLAILLLVMAIIAGWLAFNIYQRFQPPEPVVQGVTLPYPVTLSLPGGLNFDLEKGKLESGEWNPQGPEWLEGTDLCRWIAIPWSPQLEAVVHTLQRDDPIGLEMSNNDQVVYKVDSIRQLSTEEMDKLESNTPCLVLVLAKSEIETRWVITALP